MFSHTDLRILWASAGCTYASGYGKVTREVVLRLLARGVDVLTLSNQQLGFVSEYWGIKVFPHRGGRYFSNSLRPRYAELNRNLAITLFDIWVLQHVATYREVNWVPMVPVDGLLDATTEEIIRPLLEAVQLIAISQFGVEQLGALLPKDSIHYVPHGIDPAIYFRNPQSREAGRQELGIPPEQFIVLTVGNNLGDRKDFPRLFEAYQLFLEQVPEAKRDVRFFVHTNLEFRQGSCYGIRRLAKKFGIDDYLIVPKESPRWDPIEEDQMATLYNLADVFMLLTRGEGFGIPFIEAGACGVPSIATDCSAITELLQGHGWLVPPIDTLIPLTAPTHQLYCLADKAKAAEMLAEAYNSPDKLKAYGKAAEAFVHQHFHWDDIVAQKLLPVLDLVAEKLGTQPVDYARGVLGI